MKRQECSVRVARLTVPIEVPLAAEDAVLLLDVGAAQDDILPPLCVRLAHPVGSAAASEYGHRRSALAAHTHPR